MKPVPLRIANGTERRLHLQRYIVCCVRDSALSWTDLTKPMVFDKLLTILSRDVKVVLSELGRQSGAGLLTMGATMLAGIAQNVVNKKF